VFVENRRANQHQHHTADDLGTLADQLAQHTTKQHAQCHHQGGGQTDTQCSDQDVHLDESQPMIGVMASMVPKITPARVACAGPSPAAKASVDMAKDRRSSERGFKGNSSRA
jgi:hypothetical protein